MPSATKSPVYERESSDIHALLDGVAAIRITGQQTSGAFALVEELLPRGFATPLHVQPNEDTMLYVLEGELTLYLDGDLSSATTGDVVVLPRGVSKAFYVTSDRVHFLALSSPAGHEQFFRLAGEPLSSFSIPVAGQQAPDFDRLAAIATDAGFQILGPPPFDDIQAG